jgi:hypothetical protein
MLTFGRDTIQRFRSSVSELKKMTARDFEDPLQVSSLLILLFDPALTLPLHVRSFAWFVQT